MEIVFSPEADDDLRETLEYGFSEWDEDPAVLYAALPENFLLQAKSLARQPNRWTGPAETLISINRWHGPTPAYHAAEAGQIDRHHHGRPIAGRTEPHRPITETAWIPGSSSSSPSS